MSVSIRLFGFCVLVFHLFAFMAPGSAFAGSDGVEGACNAKLSDRGPYQLSSLNMFERLGLPANGTGVDLAVLKQAYRKAAQVLHPDRGGTSWAFQQISEAYKQLEAEVPERLEASTKVNYDEVDLALMSLGETLSRSFKFYDIYPNWEFDIEEFQRKTRYDLLAVMNSFNDRAYHIAIRSRRELLNSKTTGIVQRVATKYVLEILEKLDFKYVEPTKGYRWRVEEVELVRVIHSLAVDQELKFSPFEIEIMKQNPDIRSALGLGWLMKLMEQR